ncbi:MAG: hypothetical protein IKL07_03375 [Clostridium sp.]|nr:hypothetical protein [Clostridium sp.]
MDMQEDHTYNLVPPSNRKTPMNVAIGEEETVELYPYGCAKPRMTELPLVYYCVEFRSTEVSSLSYRYTPSAKTQADYTSRLGLCAI